MTAFIKSMQKAEKKIDRCAERFIWRHPLLGLLAMFIGVPVFILLAVASSTILLTLPFVWLGF